MFICKFYTQFQSLFLNEKLYYGYFFFLFFARILILHYISIVILYVFLFLFSVLMFFHFVFVPYIYIFSFVFLIFSSFTFYFISINSGKRQER
jgi:hypothetical protein